MTTFARSVETILLGQTATETNGNSEAAGNVPIEITLCVLLVLLIAANIVVFVKSKVYSNFNSASILACLTLLQVLRLINFMHRLVKPAYVLDAWVWYRSITDLTNYLLGVISIVLLVQWQQTYSVLSNPLQAITTMENNWAKVTQISICCAYTLFISFDILAIILDAQTSP